MRVHGVLEVREVRPGVRVEDGVSPSLARLPAGHATYLAAVLAPARPTGLRAGVFHQIVSMVHLVASVPAAVVSRQIVWTRPESPHHAGVPFQRNTALYTYV